MLEVITMKETYGVFPIDEPVAEDARIWHSLATKEKTGSRDVKIRYLAISSIWSAVQFCCLGSTPKRSNLDLTSCKGRTMTMACVRFLSGLNSGEVSPLKLILMLSLSTSTVTFNTSSEEGSSYPISFCLEQKKKKKSPWAKQQTSLGSENQPQKQQASCREPIIWESWKQQTVHNSRQWSLSLEKLLLSFNQGNHAKVKVALNADTKKKFLMVPKKDWEALIGVKFYNVAVHQNSIGYTHQAPFANATFEVQYSRRLVH